MATTATDTRTRKPPRCRREVLYPRQVSVIILEDVLTHLESWSESLGMPRSQLACRIFLAGMSDESEALNSVAKRIKTAVRRAAEGSP